MASEHPSKRPKTNGDELQRVSYLRTLGAVRAQAEKVFEAVKAGRSQSFTLHEDKIKDVAQYVSELARTDYATLDAIPFHSRFRHFEAGGVDRLVEFGATCSELGLDEAETARALIDLVFVSVLLDAGAGAAWVYNEAETGLPSNRSEGLGVASFRMFLAGTFSHDSARPLMATDAGLQSLAIETLAQGFQVSEPNPMDGLEGRCACVRMLGDSLSHCPDVFTRDGVTRPGYLYDYLLSRATKRDDGVYEVSVEVVWDALMRGLERMWPAGRLSIGGANMGDVWPNSLLEDDGVAGPFSPFHKLTQWLAYSLLEALQRSNVTLTNTNMLTGLPEYRNGGLLIDMGVLEPLVPDAFTIAFDPSDQFIVEWRALTVALLDRIGTQVRDILGLTVEQLPLAKILEAGTWKAGRRVAKAKREGGGPPISIRSDGTVF